MLVEILNNRENKEEELTSDMSVTPRDWFKVSYLDLISFGRLDRIFYCVGQGFVVNHLTESKI